MFKYSCTNNKESHMTKGRVKSIKARAMRATRKKR